MSAPLRPSARAWLVVGLLWVVVCSNYVARLMLTTMHGSILASLPMSEKQFGLLTSATLCMYGLTSSVAGFASDRFGRSRVIIASLLVWSTLTLLSAYAWTFGQLLVLRGLMGGSEAFYIPAALALVSEYHVGSTRSLATGLHQTGICVGIGLAGLGGWLAESHSWPFAFKAVGLGGIAYGGVLLCLLRDAPRPDSPSAGPAAAAPPPRLGEALASLFGPRCRRSFLLAMGNFGLIGIASWTAISWMPLFFHEHFQLAQGAAGFASNIYASVGTIAGVLIGGVWADRWSRTNRRARMLVPAIGLLLAAPCLLFTAYSGLLVIAIVGLVLYRLFSVFTDSNMMPVLCEIIDPRYRATAYGLLNLMGTTAASLGVFVAGVVRDFHVDLALVFVVIAGLTALCSPGFYFMKPLADTPS